MGRIKNISDEALFRKPNMQIKSAINSLKYSTLYQQQNYYDCIMNIQYIAQPYSQQ